MGLFRWGGRRRRRRRRLRCHSTKLIVYLHLLQRLRMSGIITPVPYIASWRAQGQIQLYKFFPVYALLLKFTRVFNVCRTTKGGRSLRFVYKHQPSACTTLDRQSSFIQMEILPPFPVGIEKSQNKFTAKRNFLDLFYIDSGPNTQVKASCVGEVIQNAHSM